MWDIGVGMEIIGVFVTDNMGMYYLLVVAGILLCAYSQILLKRSANRKHKSILESMLNWRVILAYGIFFLSMIINITAMSKGVNVKEMPILESLGYVFVPLLSFLFLKETISIRTIASICFILIGIYIFYL